MADPVTEGELKKTLLTTAEHEQTRRRYIVGCFDLERGVAVGKDPAKLPPGRPPLLDDHTVLLKELIDEPPRYIKWDRGSVTQAQRSAP